MFLDVFRCEFPCDFLMHRTFWVLQENIPTTVITPAEETEEQVNNGGATPKKIIRRCPSFFKPFVHLLICVRLIEFCMHAQCCAGLTAFGGNFNSACMHFAVLCRVDCFWGELQFDPFVSDEQGKMTSVSWP